MVVRVAPISRIDVWAASSARSRVDTGPPVGRAVRRANAVGMEQIMGYCSSMSETTRAGNLPLPPMTLSRWGADSDARELGDGIRDLLREVLGVSAESGAAFDPAAVRASPSRLDDDDIAALVALVGAGNVSVDDEQRLPRARGKSTPDLLAWRLRPEVTCPDAVVAPGDDDEVAALLAWC